MASRCKLQHSALDGLNAVTLSRSPPSAKGAVNRFWARPFTVEREAADMTSDGTGYFPARSVAVPDGNQSASFEEAGG